MNTPTNTTKGFISLGLVFGLGMLGLSIAATTLIFSVGSLTKNAHALSGVRTLSVADSAVHEGVYQVMNGATAYSGGSFPTLNFTSASSIVADDTAWPIVFVTGEAENARGAVRRINYAIDMFPSLGALDHAIYSWRNINLQGNSRVDGSIFSNDDITIPNSGNPAIPTVTGNAYAGGSIIDSHNRIGGNTFNGVQELRPPTIDLDDYEKHASSTGTYFTNTADAQAYIQNNQNYNQIVYVANAGDVPLQLGINQTRLTGILIVTGNLTLTGGRYEKAGVAAAIVGDEPFDEPMVIYVGGEFSISGNTIVRGIVFVHGNTSVGNGTGSIDGSLVSTGEHSSVNNTGNFAVTYDPDNSLLWEDISGLNFGSGSSPRVSGWHEL